MKQICFRVLGNEHDAEDATNEAIAKVWRHPPGELRTTLKAWLCGAARNTAIDLALARARQPTVLVESVEDNAVCDHINQSQVRARVAFFVDQVEKFLTDDIRADLDLYLEVRRGDAPQEEPAGRVKDRRRRVREAVHYAGFVACLIIDPGEGANLCAVPRRYAALEETSPQLLKKIRAHVRKCDRCRGKHGDSRSLFKTAKAILLAIPGVAAAPGLLDKIWKTFTAKPALAGAAAVTTGAGVVAGVFLLVPEPVQPQVGLPVQPVRTSTPPASATPPLPPADPPTTTTGTSAIPGPSQPPPPPSEPPASPNSGVVARDDRPPSISRAWIEHRRIATTRSRCDEDAPTDSKVGVTVNAPSGVRSVTLLVRVRGRLIERPMINVAGAWFRQIGPFSEENAGQAEVTVRVVGMNDAETSQQLGTVWVTSCADDEW